MAAVSRKGQNHEASLFLKMTRTISLIEEIEMKVTKISILSSVGDRQVHLDALSNLNEVLVKPKLWVENGTVLGTYRNSNK